MDSGSQRDKTPVGGPEVLPLGSTALLLRFGLSVTPSATAAVQVLHDMLDHADLPGVTEILPSLASVMLRFDPAKVTRADLAARLATLTEARDWHAATPRPATRRWQVPVAFGGVHGPMLEEAAALAGVSPEAAVRQIAETELRVLAIGFAPGQPYLGLLPETWNLPRLSDLAPQVPQGAVTVAVRQIVLFANASPTGWRQIGRAAFRPFRPETRDPAPLRAGDALRLVPCSGDELEALLRAGDPDGGARCQVQA
ncbi:allophanate hydrolase [Gemmobacter nanjingensis]|uniref:Allophanate hydrolase n=1 Tax=Gemmobacter nanjingensis TaxID=488454 RepID=A0ABQ3FA47_9RHOB|nr:carboxyltransferase domain-containing protein [Gemmobacter nanjingensis]GHC15509.1 allophanate hydrolase [Gemmobacter nanjingensis]